MPLQRSWRRRKLVPRKVVFLCDVSGSMEPYARAMVMFLQAMTQAGRRVEAFAFGTRLTRLTPALRGRDPAHALRLAAEAMPDWGGGTRIGESLAAYNAKYGRASMTRGAVVVIVSDGWERGGLEQLDSELARIARSAHLLVWVNPLKGHTGFEPLAGGMRVALPARRRVPGRPQPERDRLAGGGAGRGQLMQGPVETGVVRGVGDDRSDRVDGHAEPAVAGTVGCEHHGHHPTGRVHHRAAGVSVAQQAAQRHHRARVHMVSVGVGRDHCHR